MKGSGKGPGAPTVTPELLEKLLTAKGVNFKGVGSTSLGKGGASGGSTIKSTRLRDTIEIHQDRGSSAAGSASSSSSSSTGATTTHKYLEVLGPSKVIEAHKPSLLAAAMRVPTRDSEGNGNTNSSNPFTNLNFTSSTNTSDGPGERVTVT